MGSVTRQRETKWSAPFTTESGQPTIWLGDFNRHHLHWNNPTDTRLFTRPVIHDAEILISAVAELSLDLVPPPSIPTHLHHVTKKWMQLNQVFVTDAPLSVYFVYF